MQPGDRVKGKVKGGDKFRGVVTDVRIESDSVGAPGEQVAGPRRAIVVIELEFPNA
jgi:hypothetical protein